MALIQQRPPNRKAARNYNQIGDVSGEWGCFQGMISEDFLNFELNIKYREKLQQTYILHKRRPSPHSGIFQVWCWAFSFN